MNRVVAADCYHPPDDLAVVTAYFNAGKYHSLLDNYKRFAESMRQSGIELFTVEAAFGDEPFELPAAECTIQVRSSSILWQKERLLNLAVQRLPERFLKIAWIDADVFFVDRLWAVKASAALERCAVAQLFSGAINLAQGADCASPTDKWIESFASAYNKHAGKRRDGHPGLAWAARRDIVEMIGLYEACPLGGADTLMAIAMCEEQRSGPRELEFFHGNARRLDHYRNWAQRFSAEVSGRLECIPGTVLHRWHGNRKNRCYKDRSVPLAYFGFDPDRDLEVNSEGCLEWKTSNRDLIDYCADYFKVVRNNDSDEADDQYEMASLHPEWFQNVHGPPALSRLRRLYRRHIPLEVRLTLHDWLTSL